MTDYESQARRQLSEWQREMLAEPGLINRTFQQEYRDYIDFAKMAQLLPIVGAPVGMIVNNRLVRKLGLTAMNAYRMRWFADAEARPRILSPQQAADSGD